MSDTRKLSILVVDDEPEFCRFVADCLGEQDYEVRTVHDGEAALDALTDPADLVLCDYRMKGMTGMEVIARAREIDPSVPIILITAFGSIDHAVAAMREGAYDYLTKPVEVDELRQHIGRALEARRLRSEVVRLRRLAEDRASLHGVIAESDGMRNVIATIRQLERSTSNVFVTGESGTGKELVARAIHMHSPVASGPFIAVNCAAIPEHLLESELFGHKRGAFTDARADKVGLFQAADRGTLFLDEVGELAPSLQAKMLRVLEDGSVRRIGSTKSETVEVRVVAATNRRLEEDLDKGFRSDLFYRLNVVEIHIPPLRERPEDIPALVDGWLRAAGNGAPKRISREAMQLLCDHPWPGNVRQLRNAIEHGLAMSADGEIRVDDLPASVHAGVRDDCETQAVETVDVAHPSLSLKEIEERYIHKVLQHTGGNRSAAAAILGIDRKTLYKRLQK